MEILLIINEKSRQESAVLDWYQFKLMSCFGSSDPYVKKKYVL